MIVILAAGRGSRFEGLPENTSKCVYPFNGGTTSLTRLLHQLRKRRNPRERVAVVAGYANDSVTYKVFEEFPTNSGIQFILNPLWNSYGCNYSLTLAIDQLKDTLKSLNEPITIFEGDAVYSDANLDKVMASRGSSFVLARDPSYLSSRSVVVLEMLGRVRQFGYDQTHQVNDFSAVPKVFQGIKLYDSMQIWNIASDAKDYFVTLCEEYVHRYLSDQPLASGVFTINRYVTHCADMMTLLSDDPDGWVNINSIEDTEKAKEMINRG